MKKIFQYLSLTILLIGMINTLTAQKQFRALLFTKTMGFHHESIHEGVSAMRELAGKHNFDLDWQEDPGKFNDNNLAKFDIIIFLNTTGDILNDVQQAAMEKFIQSGKGFVGIHSATDTEYGWEWYTKLVGRSFKIHPVIQSAKLKFTSNKFPGLSGFNEANYWTEEWYDFGPEKINGLNYILAVDESTYNPKVQWGENKSEGMGAFHPMAWYHEFDGGRAFYTALGHMPADYSDPAFLNHVFAGILYAAKGKK
ncbi:MAG: ThuA domain-containing protein [Saprospiraceae bacterium]|jgi:type 1 glutamine amidotransferase|nr:ThuA domain-containing protein [Saprospiraceae bacterium]MBK6478179.1 ThuA domain-containing protein [Saprospiraceae bacterium]MBK6817667.1 ThuA domain-containing protein [Saprospiraceae bacterium]MBK7373040.1 ThuA domain-containing protein [Saprospiraceae bacterium]MBK7439805.1 ThuA domain-containing protein [Saprospiraceae bacterium]